jgi:signal transduction histidine kinase
VRFVTRVPEELPLVACPPRRLAQVLLNLVINACDAVEESPEGRGEVTLVASATAGTVTLEVADSGPGISPEVLPHLFEAFVTSKPVGKGTGLGLSLSREVVVASGGTMTGANRPEGGACFTVTLAVDPG